MKKIKYLWLIVGLLCLTGVVSGAYHHIITTLISAIMCISGSDKLKIKE